MMAPTPRAIVPLPVALLVVGCAGHAAPPSPVAPVPVAATPHTVDTIVTAGRSRPDTLVIAAAPPAREELATRAAREVAAEVAAAADSLADLQVLEALEHGRPQLAEPGSDSAFVVPGARWDLEVARWTEHDRVQFWMEFFQGRARDRFEIWLARLPRYESTVRRLFEREGLATDLVYLALIESGFSNIAVSRAKAVGMWQFMRGTARMYGLRVDPWVDERRDWPRATDAAVRYLHDLQRQFGSPYLAAAAYNAGGGKISRSLAKAGRMGTFDDLDDDDDEGFSDEHFFRLSDTRLLRRETRDYVPKLIAAALIAKEPTRYGFAPVVAADTMVPDSAVVDGLLTLDVAARLADTSLAAMRELNPHLLRLAVPPVGGAIVRLPHGRGAAFTAALAALPAESRVSFRTHVAGKAETVASVARKYEVDEADLRAANPRVTAGRFRAGQKVVVPLEGPVSVLVARHFAEPAAPRIHRVRKGETLASIARRYDVSVGDLRAWNRLSRSATRAPAGARLRVSDPVGISTTSLASGTPRVDAPRPVAPGALGPGAAATKAKVREAKRAHALAKARTGAKRNAPAAAARKGTKQQTAKAVTRKRPKKMAGARPKGTPATP